MVMPKSELHNLVIKSEDGSNSCKLCGDKLSKNITRIKVHFMKKCKQVIAIKIPGTQTAKPTPESTISAALQESTRNYSSASTSAELEESVGIDHEFEDLVKTQVKNEVKSEDINCN